MPNISYDQLFLAIVPTLVISLIVLFIQHKRKELSYKIISFGPLVQREDALAQKLQVLYDGKQVLNPHVAIVRIANTGNVPITTTDFEKALIMKCEPIHVLYAEISDKAPSDLRAELEFTESDVTLKPTLLNKYDYITISMLTEAKNNISIDARIAGIKKVEEWKGGTIEKYIFPTVVIAFFILLGVGIIKSFIENPKNLLPLLNMFISIAVLIGAGLIMTALIKFKERYRRHPMN